jgi:2-keto-3-deoxy-L-rhamnonate aldolase RhmA
VRRNVLREGLATGRPLFGSFLNFPDASLVEFTGLCGFDWVLFDAEHEGLDVPTCYELVRAADAVGIGTVVRVPRNDPEAVLGYAETGVNAVLAPHVATVEAAERLVDALSFPPAGVRGISATSRAANYGLTQDAGTYLAATTHALSVALLEDDVPLEVTTRLVSESDIDIFTIGPGDLAASMGHPGQAGHEEVQRRVGDLARIVTTAGKTLLMPASSVDDAGRALELGATLVVTSNAGLLRQAMSEYLAGVRALPGVEAAGPAATGSR